MNNEYDMLKLDNQLCFPLYAAAKGIVRYYKPFLDKLDMTYTQYITMMVMWEHKTLTVKELGRYLYLDSGTLTPLLKTMEKKGWIERKRSLEDERVLNVMLTTSGEQLKEQAVKIPKQIAEGVNLESEEAMQLYAILHKLLKNFYEK